MNPIFVKRLRNVSSVGFILGMATAGYAYYLTRDPKPKTTGFTLYSTMSFTPDGSTQAQITGSRVRYQRADGSFKQVVTYFNPDGSVKKTSTLFGELGRGVYELSGDEKALVFVSPMRAEISQQSEADLRKLHDHQTLREEFLLGHKTLVARILDGGDTASYTELYHAVELQGFQIKTVLVSKVGTTTIDPVKIEIGEPDKRSIGMPKLPVDYDRFELKIKAMEESGQGETAETLRQQLADAKRQ